VAVTSCQLAVVVDVAAHVPALIPSINGVSKAFVAASVEVSGEVLTAKVAATRASSRVIVMVVGEDSDAPRVATTEL